MKQESNGELHTAQVPAKDVIEVNEVGAVPQEQTVALGTTNDIAVIGYLKKAKENLQEVIDKSKGNKGVDAIIEAQECIDNALTLAEMPRMTRRFHRWFVLFRIVLAGLAQIFFIELYCRWHGAEFLSPNLYSPENIAKLSNLTFVNGATTMSVTAEVMMWSSLGVWAQASYRIGRSLLTSYPADIASYIGTLARNTSVAAIVVIILRLSKFSVFGVSLDPSSPFAFDATIGLSFLLGFFGDDAYQLISHFRSKLVGNVVDDRKD